MSRTAQQASVTSVRLPPLIRAEAVRDVFDTLTGKELGSVKAHSGAVRAIAFTRDGKFMATASPLSSIARSIASALSGTVPS